MNKHVMVIGDKNSVHIFLGLLAKLQYNLSIVVVQNLRETQTKIKDHRPNAIIFDDDYVFKGGRQEKDLVYRWLGQSENEFLVISSNKSFNHILKIFQSGAVDFLIRPFHEREVLSRIDAYLRRKRRIACLGGGTGLFNLLLGLKTLQDVHLTSIVSTSDDGGSSGRLMSSFGILPPGDIRRSLVALSNAPDILNELMKYRFEKGRGLKGHNFGNLILTALADMSGSVRDGVRSLCEILNIQGIILPITTTQTTLCAQFENKKIVKGESNIDLGKSRDLNLRIRRLWHNPPTSCDMDVVVAILSAEVVILGPGDLYTSVITNLLVRYVRQAIAFTKGKILYICNLMTKPGETPDFDGHDHVSEIIKYLKGDHLDHVIFSNSQPSGEALQKYSAMGQRPVVLGDVKQIKKVTAANLHVSNVGHEYDLIRHDSLRIASFIERAILRN